MSKKYAKTEFTMHLLCSLDIQENLYQLPQLLWPSFQKLMQKNRKRKGRGQEPSHMILRNLRELEI